jgi:uncharacterized membrane protein YGL010W
MRMFRGISTDEWIARYEQGHQHPVNRVCHVVGIPMIGLSLLVALVALGVGGLWWVAIALFAAGWIFQFVGHAFEGKPPEFFKDWRFLFIGLSWWSRKVTGRV